MPQGQVPTLPVRLHHNCTTSKRESTSLEPAREERGAEAEPPPPVAGDQPEWTPTLELHSEDEDDPLDWDKFLAQQERASTEFL